MLWAGNMRWLGGGLSHIVETDEWLGLNTLLGWRWNKLRSYLSVFSR